jgi:hypothetical protein
MHRKVQGYGEECRDMGVRSLGIWERYRDMGKKVQGYGEKGTGIWGRVPQNKGEVILLDTLHF